MALLAWALTGCADHDPTYHADLAFTADERAAILVDAAQLVGHTGHAIQIEFDGELSERTIHKVAHGSPGCIQYTAHTQTIFVNPDGTGARPAMSSAAQDVAKIVTHELAHGIGMGHVADVGSLMAKWWRPGGFTWTADDEREMERARLNGWALEYEETRTCITAAPNAR